MRNEKKWKVEKNEKSDILEMWKLGHMRNGKCEKWETWEMKRNKKCSKWEEVRNANKREMWELRNVENDKWETWEMERVRYLSLKMWYIKNVGNKKREK